MTANEPLVPTRTDETPVLAAQGAGDQMGCDVTVNSEKRARVWYPTYPELKEPDLWNWKLVASHSRRLQRSLKSLAQQAVRPDRREDPAPG
jgi:hypothetical protein